MQDKGTKVRKPAGLSLMRDLDTRRLDSLCSGDDQDSVAKVEAEPAESENRKTSLCFLTLVFVFRLWLQARQQISDLVFWPRFLTQRLFPKSAELKLNPDKTLTQAPENFWQSRLFSTNLVSLHALLMPLSCFDYP